MNAKRVAPPKRRTITEVPDKELEEAVMDMVNRLHFPGRGEGYNLYEAVLKEKKKAVELKNEANIFA